MENVFAIHLIGLSQLVAVSCYVYYENKLYFATESEIKIKCNVSNGICLQET